jgi:two-component system phosphate regulon response regulator PhoB
MLHCHDSATQLSSNSRASRARIMTAKRILIVEDEPAIRQMIAFGLRRAGFEVREAVDYREAREALADQRPDLVLIDWMLPDMSGLACSQLHVFNLEQDLQGEGQDAQRVHKGSERDKVSGWARNCGDPGLYDQA